MLDFDTPARRIFSVSEINSETKKLLEQRFFSVFIRGEVSNFSAPRSGHWYFTLKDDAAQIRVVMFKQSNFKHKQPQLGDELVVGGQLSFYRERGEVQIIASQIRPAGLGDLQQQFELLKKKLLDEGLFDQSLKRDIPVFPKKIAVISSPTGAVIQDIARVCSRRAAIVPIVLIPVHVQGQDAAKNISEAILSSQTREGIELIILARGGGSLEDFVAFNSEQVARAIASSQIPIISGVGHETDVSISDYVADIRAATPSEAAELATAGYQNLAKQLSTVLSRLTRESRVIIERYRNRSTNLSIRIKHPADDIRRISQKLDYLETRLSNHSKTIVSERRNRIVALTNALHPRQLVAKVENANQILAQIQLRLERELMLTTDQRKDRFGKTVALLEAMNPLSTMTRGYSITFDSNDKLVQSVKQVTKGQKLKVRLADGVLESNIEKVILERQ